MVQEPGDHLKVEANMRQETLELNITCYTEVPSLSRSQGNPDPGSCPLNCGQTRNCHDLQHTVVIPVDCIVEAASRNRDGMI